MSKRNQQSPTAVILDGCALLWTIAWPDQGKVEDVVDLFIDLMLNYIAISDVYLIFDRYEEFSIKGCNTPRKS